jgi:hypothetical protein
MKTFKIMLNFLLPLFYSVMHMVFIIIAGPVLFLVGCGLVSAGLYLVVNDMMWLFSFIWMMLIGAFFAVVGGTFSKEVIFEELICRRKHICAGF